MIRRSCSILFSVLLLVSPEVNAQKKSEEINQSIQNVAHALSDIFHKKKSTDKENPNKGDNGKAVTNQQANNNANTASTSTSIGKSFLPKLGQLAPNAKAIVADEMFSFNDGAAIIRNGSAYALIDTTGNFIIPYNKYNLRLEGATYDLPNGYMFNNGFFYFYDGLSKSGYLNSKGKILEYIEGNNNWKPSGEILMSDVRAPDSYNVGKRIAQDIQTVVTKDGKKYQIIHDDGSPAAISEGIALRSHNGKYFYTTLSGKRITNTEFDDAGLFTDGMAMVGQKDQFGNVKYGFINTKGELVIPYKFSIRPHDFSQGYARVEPKDKSSFDYAFINKKGEIVFKQTDADEAKYGVFNDFEPYGMAYSYNYFLTKDLKLISTKDFFRSYGAPEDAHVDKYNGLSSMYNPKSPKLFFTSGHYLNPIVKHGGVIGFINLATGKTVLPVFDEIKPFDPVSGLAYAEVMIGLDKNRMAVYKKGYVNEDGLFVLVQKGEDSQW